MNTFAVNSILVIGSIFLSLLAGEVLTRAYLHLADEPTILDLTKPTPRDYRSRVDLGQLLQTAEHETIVYELRANARATFLDARVTTNSHGFRSRREISPKHPEAVRILGLGDSLMFGWGVSDGEEYLSLLEQKLNKGNTKIRVEIINTAVPGYNTELELQTLKQKGLKLHPDLVLLGFVESNDFHLPSFARSRKSLTTLSHSFLLQLPMTAFSLEPYHPSLLHEPLIRDTGTLLRKQLAEFNKLSKQHGFKLLAYFHEPITEKTATIFTQRNIRTVYAWPRIEERLKSEGIQNYKGSRFTLSESDPHPSRIGHRLAARVLYREIIPFLTQQPSPTGG